MVKDLNIVKTGENCSSEMLDFLECAVKAGCSIVIGGSSRTYKTMLMQYLSISIDRERQVICVDMDNDFEPMNLGWNAYIHMTIDGIEDGKSLLDWIWKEDYSQLFPYLIEPSEERLSTIIYAPSLLMNPNFTSFIAHSPCNSQFIFQTIGSPHNIAYRIEMNAAFNNKDINKDIWADEKENPFNKISVIVTLSDSTRAERCIISDISVVDRQQSKKDHECVLVQLFKGNWTRYGDASFEASENKIPADLAQILEKAGYPHSKTML